MVKIIADTSTLYSTEEGKKNGVLISPLQVTANNSTYLEYDEISTKEFIRLIKEEGAIPTSSQPPIGIVLDRYEQVKEDEEGLNITMTDGLSGTWQTAVMAQNQFGSDRIHVLDSKSLCGPHRYFVDNAVRLANEGKTVQEIIDILTPSIENCSSWLIPQDFDYLVRGGRLSKTGGTLIGVLKLVITLIHSEDKKKLDAFSVARTYKKALSNIANAMKKAGVNENYEIFICHATDDEQAKKTVDFFKEAFPGANVTEYFLSPAFVTQGGPGCLAIQYAMKIAQ